MHGSLIRRAVVAASLISAAFPVVALAVNMNVTAGDVTLGDHVSGPTVDATGLTGRVVVLEFWGVHCPPCIASMPQLESLHKQFAPQGLLVIGAHAQGGEAEDVRKVVNELGVTFAIVDHATVDGGMDFDGIPHCMVFDHTGKCIHRGSPSAAHDVIVAAVQVAPAAILAGRTLAKLAPLGEMLKNESQCGAVLKRARGSVESKDPDTAEEARYVIERVEGRGRQMLDRARGLAESDAFSAAALAQRCAAAFKGSDIGVEAGKLLQTWKKDKEFQSAFRAGQQLARLEELQAAAARLPGGVPPQAKREAAEIARAIEKGWPGSDVAAKASFIVAQMNSAAADTN